MPEKKIVYVDTNSFLHVKDMKDLPWRTLFPGVEEIDLMVASVVIEELDRHKNGSNQRRRNRSRAALKLVDKASENEDFSLVLREAPVLIRLVLADGGAIDWSQFPRLDSSKPDDRLVAEAAIHSSSAVVFTHDTGPRISARRAQLDAKAPLEDWLLPAEQTDDDRRIRQLERELEAANAKHPKISLILGRQDEESSTATLYRPILRPLSEGLSADLKANYLAQNQRSQLRRQPQFQGMAFDLLRSGPSDEQIDRYYEEYRNFERAVEAHFDNLHEKVFQASLAQAVPYKISNLGRVSASSLSVEHRVIGNAWIIEDEEEAQSQVVSLLPMEAPEPPKSRDIMRDYFIRDTFPSLREPRRDPTKFYWVDRPSAGAVVSGLHCEDFRAAEVFEDTVWLYLNLEPSATSELMVKISATNLPSPIEKTLTLSIESKEFEWTDPQVLWRLPEGVREIVERGGL